MSTSHAKTLGEDLNRLASDFEEVDDAAAHGPSGYESAVATVSKGEPCSGL